MNTNITITILMALILMIGTSAAAQSDAPAKVPFNGMDLSWINGQSRQGEFPIVLNGIGTASLYVDGYFNYNFANPQDNTQTISGTTGRHKEFTLSLASIGFDANYKNCLGRVFLQTGQFLETAHETDGSVLHGRNTGTDNLRYVREAAAGYHFNSLYGVNLEMGLFTSYVGLESYLSYENWNYQRAMVSDFTPFFFTGVRLQAYLTGKTKAELWLMNGWQSYSSWNE